MLFFPWQCVYFKKYNIRKNRIIEAVKNEINCIRLPKAFIIMPLLIVKRRFAAWLFTISNFKFSYVFSPIMVTGFVKNFVSKYLGPDSNVAFNT